MLLERGKTLPSVHPSQAVQTLPHLVLQEHPISLSLGEILPRPIILPDLANNGLSEVVPIGQCAISPKGG